MNLRVPLWGLAAGALVAGALAVAPSSQATFRGPNGRLVFQKVVGSHNQLFTVRPDGSDLRQVTSFTDSDGEVPGWSKDGSRLVFNRHFNPDSPQEKLILYTARADGTGMHALKKAGTGAVEPTWFPDGKHILFVSYPEGRLKLINADGTGLRSAGVPGPGGNSCVLPGNKRIALLRAKSVNDDSVSAIFIAGLYGHGLKRISPFGTYADKIDCSPDGRRIAYSAPAFGEGGQSSNVYTMRIDGSAVAQLTHDADGTVNNGLDSWSPDGTKIAYVSNTSGEYQIWTMNADGTGAAALTNGTEAHRAAWGANQ
jgi:Tol biopolymer transport system component